jgi:REP element-mobilizing transposase RayT
MNPLRNPNINYRKGWFFVTFQVARNKTVFGVVADKKLILNALVRMVDENLRNLGRIFKELYIDTVMVMPNHVHAVIKIESVIHDLSYFTGRFKSFMANRYQRMAKAGECVDIGPSLWQGSYYDNLISSHDELENVRRYTLRNPELWEDDRFGPVTAYLHGNVELLNCDMVAFVASDIRDNWKKEKPHIREVHEWFGRESIGKDAPLGMQINNIVGLSLSAQPIASLGLGARSTKMT